MTAREIYLRIATSRAYVCDDTGAWRAAVNEFCRRGYGFATIGRGEIVVTKTERGMKLRSRILARRQRAAL